MHDATTTTAAPANYGTTRQRLLANGYDPIPCHGKRPRLTDWQNKVGVPGFDGDNAGLLTARAPALDSDLDDADAAAAVAGVVRGRFPAALCRHGKGHKCLYLFRLDGAPFRKLRREFEKDGKRGAVEVLADGQQAVAFGVHPATGQPYHWAGPSPLTVPRDSLPAIDEAAARGLLADITEALAAVGWAPVNPDAGRSSLVRRHERLPDTVFASTPYSLRKAVDALAWLDAEDYGSWIAAGHHLWAEFDGADSAFQLWLEWSRTAPNFDPDACEKRWASFKPHSAGLHSLYRGAGLPSAVLDFEVIDDDGNATTPDRAASAPKKTASAQAIEDMIACWDNGRFEDFLTVHEPQMLVDKIIPAGQVGLLQAGGGTGKTSLSLYLHCCIGAGVPFFGLKVRKGKTVFLSADDSQADLKSALALVIRNNEIFHGHEQDIYRNVAVISLREVNFGTTSLVEVIDKKLYVVSDFARRLCEGIAKRGGVVLVELDTARQFNAADSSDEAAAKAFMQAAQLIANLPSKPAVLVPHHVSKAVHRNGIDDMYAGHGSNAYSDNARFGFNLFEIDSAKLHEEVRFGGEAVPICKSYFRLSPTRGSLLIEKSGPIYYGRTGWQFEHVVGTRKSADERLADFDKKVLDTVRHLYADRAEGKAGVSKSAIEREVKGDDKATRAAIDRLLTKGLIEYAEPAKKKSPLRPTTTSSTTEQERGE